MTDQSALLPPILWAQRNDTVLLTVNLTDIKNEKYSLEEKVFKFSGNGGPEGHYYSVELEFLKEVIPQESKNRRTDRGLYFVIKKKVSGPYWAKLWAGSTKPHYIHTDFNKWRDEDESSSEAEDPSEDPNLSTLMQQMGGMGGMPGMGGMGGMGGMPGMGGMGGMAGMGGMEGMGGMANVNGPGLGNMDDLDDNSSDDSDDQDIPDLES